VRLHKIIQPVTDTDALHVFMRANIATICLINFPLFHVDIIAQDLQTPGAAVITGDDEFAVFLFSSGLRFSQAVLSFRQSSKACLSVTVVTSVSPGYGGAVSCKSPLPYGATSGYPARSEV